MNILDLYEQLKVKGYQEPHLYGIDYLGPCKEDENGDSDYVEQQTRLELELDRRSVFRVWYGDETDPTYGVVDTLPPIYSYVWDDKLREAQEQYRLGKIAYVVDYLLQNP